MVYVQVHTVGQDGQVEMVISAIWQSTIRNGLVLPITTPIHKSVQSIKMIELCTLTVPKDGADEGEDERDPEPRAGHQHDLHHLATTLEVLADHEGGRLTSQANTHP